MKGRQAFEAYYKRYCHSPEECEALFRSLLHKHIPVLYIPKSHRSQLTYKPLSWFEGAYLWPDTVPFGQTLPGFTENWFYPLALSSLLPIIALDLQTDLNVLDACAAPGGKALIIADHLNEPAQLVANDLSPDRTHRLRTTLKNFGFSSTVTMMQPAEKLWVRFPEIFERVLVDAPCSSEAHTYSSPAHLSQWSLKRIESLQHRQLGLLASLFKTLSVGGRLVYSTCAVTDEENEVVVEKILRLLPGIRTVKPAFSSAMPGELSKFNTWRVWPHRHHTSPMFVAVFTKDKSFL